MTPDRNLLSYLPTALAQYPQYVAGSEAAHQAILGPGLPGRLRADLGVQPPRLLGPDPADPARGARPRLRR